jgi:YidC/Oxa1 family membrane protein insertase
MFDAIARVLAFFYSLPVVGGSYGLAIILLTASVMVLLMPLTIRATRSMIKMQEVQPKLKELQKKYKDDKATLNSELMELYKSEGINPVGGCLPMVAQLPVFLVLFRVLRGLSRRVAETPFYSVSQHARARVGLPSLTGDRFDPSYLDTHSKMYQDLHKVDSMGFGPFDLARHPLDVIQSDFVRGIPYVLLILFVVGTSYYQQRQISARRTGSMPINPQQEMILKFLPLMSGFWSLAFPAGLVLYWATSNSFRILQQTYITRAFYSAKDGDGGATVGGATSAPGRGGGSKAAVEAESRPAKASGSSTNGSKASSYRDGKSPRTRTGRQAPRPNGEDAASSGTDDPTTNADGDRTGRDKADRDRAHGDGAHGHGAGNDQGGGKARHADRSQAWDQRRREKARLQAAKNRAEPSSRVTPKGTKPTDSKKKRKR